jgi:hypothetical protein
LRQPDVAVKESGGGELDRLVRLGHLTRVSKAPLAPFRPTRQKGLPLSEVVVADREDRF